MTKKGEYFFLRVWTKSDVTSIRKHLMVIDDFYGTCGNCKQIGLNYINEKICKGCGTEFRYLATNQKKISEVAKILDRIQKDDLNFTLIDRDDFDFIETKTKAEDLFS